MIPNLIDGKRFYQNSRRILEMKILVRTVMLPIACLLLGGCATDTMTKAELVEAFNKCGVREEFSIGGPRQCLVKIAEGREMVCDIVDLDPVTKAALLKNGTAERRYLPAGTVLPVKTQDGADAAVPIDFNTGVILDFGDDKERLYLAEAAWVSGDYFVGFKSRVLKWGKIIKLSDIQKVELYSEMTFKRSLGKSCLNRL